MPIEAVGTKEEKESDFFLRNKELCQRWQEFIESNYGSIDGKYSAWALHLQATFVKNDINWSFQINKSTLTNGNLVTRNKPAETVVCKASPVKYFICSFQVKEIQVFSIKNLIDGIKSREVPGAPTRKLYISKEDIDASNEILETLDPLFTDKLISLDFNLYQRLLEIRLEGTNPDFVSLEKVISTIK